MLFGPDDKPRIGTAERVMLLALVATMVVMIAGTIVLYATEGPITAPFF